MSKVNIFEIFKVSLNDIFAVLLCHTFILSIGMYKVTFPKLSMVITLYGWWLRLILLQFWKFLWAIILLYYFIIRLICLYCTCISSIFCWWLFIIHLSPRIHILIRKWNKKIIYILALINSSGGNCHWHWVAVLRVYGATLSALCVTC